MTGPMVFDRIQIFAILFSLCIFGFIFSLVKHRRIREEYSLLWFALSLFLLYLSIDRFAIDRLGRLFGVAYPPSVLTLMTTGFTFLLLVHLTVVVTRLSEQNKEVIQELGLWRCHPSGKAGDLLVIIPAYNEQDNIGAVLHDLAGLDLACDILVVNDGSQDRTSQAARAVESVLVIDLPKNLGIGGAVQTGFKFAERNGYGAAVQFDGDGQHIAAELPRLMEHLQMEKADMVIGSRFLAEIPEGYRSTRMRRFGIRLFQTINSLLIGQRVTDNTSGFRVYNRPAIEFLARHYPVDYPEPEAVILLGRNGFRIAETQVRMRPRQAGGSSIAGLKGGYYMIKVLLAILMTALRRPVVDGRRKT